MKFHPLIKMILLCFAINLASCTLTTKLGDSLFPEAEYNTLLVKANAAMHDGEWAKAVVLYEKAGQLKPSNWDVKLMLAQAYRNDGKLAQSFNTYQIIIDAKTTAHVVSDITLKTAQENQAKLGYKNEASVTQVDEIKVATPPLLEEGKLEEVVPTEMEKQLIPIPAQPEELNKDIATQSPPEVLLVHDDERILETVNAWASAWETKNLDVYFGYYVDNFAGDMVNAKAWRNSRKSKIERSKKIKITLSAIKIEYKQDSVIVVFKQSYESGTYQDVGRKTLEMVKVQDRWLINKELFN